MSVPVNRLPPEILSRILENRTRERDLVVATHVCQYWRSTLISAPPLWGCFQFRSGHDLDRTLTYLERSKSASIDVAIDLRLSPDREVFKHLAPHLARTRSLIMQGSHGIHAASLLFCNPAPSLQLLNIRSRQGFAPLPENFLGQQAPSLNLVNLTGICPTFESPFPLPNLVGFNLHLPKGTGLFRVEAMFRFLSGCPRLRKVQIDIPDKTLQGIAQGQVFSLESLVELGYAHNPGGRVLPCLKLPRLEQLQVSSSLGPVQVQKLDDILPCDSRRLLAGITKMFYHSEHYSLAVDLSGNGVDISLAISRTVRGTPSVGWFSDQACIPFDQIEDLRIEGYFPVDFPLSFFAFENLEVLRMARWSSGFVQGLLRLLYPDPVVGVPCRSLREFEFERICREFREPPLMSLIRLVRERKRAGHQLELVRLSIAEVSDQSLVEELRKHVGEVQVVVRTTSTVVSASPRCSTDCSPLQIT